MSETLKLWTSSVYPHEEGRFLGTLTFATRPASATEPITGATGELAQEVDAGRLTTMQDVLDMVQARRMQMAWEGEGEFGSRMPHHDQDGPTP